MRIFKYSSFLALLWAVSTPVMAAPPPSGAQIELSAPATEKEFIIEGALWTCEGNICTTSRAPDMPVMRVCRRVVAETGPAQSFTLRGKAFDETQLVKCNAAAKP